MRLSRVPADYATERELEAAALKAQYQRDMALKQAGFQAETEQAKARAAQAGPLAEAQESQQVIEQQTALAQRQADLATQRLEAEVRRPADAEAYRKRTIAEAERDQARFSADADAYRKRTLAEAERDQARFSADADAYRKRTLAEAERDEARLAADAEAYRNTTLAAAEAQAAKVRAEAAAHAARATAKAQADANEARAASLREGNQELIAANHIIEDLPALVDAAARGIAGSQLTILNGAQGVNEIVAGLVGQGLSILDVLRKSTTAAAGNGALPAQPSGGKDVQRPG